MLVASMTSQALRRRWGLQAKKEGSDAEDGEARRHTGPYASSAKRSAAWHRHA